MTIETRLADIRARVESATEGPWEAGPREGGLAEVNTAPAHAAWLTDTTRPVIYEVVNQALRADAEFIAHARTDLPALLAAVEAVKEKCDRIIDEFEDPVYESNGYALGAAAAARTLMDAITTALEVQG